MLNSPINKLHIVAFDVPYPPDYGGAIDIFYKLKNLNDAGCKIYFHCFEYGRAHSEELKKYCKELLYYPRVTGIKGMSMTLPYIVSSRKSTKLLKRLVDIDAPILFEGIHSTYYLSHPSLKTRYKAIRIHNTEHDYYKQLSQKEQEFYKKIYFRSETTLLKKYDQKLQDAQAFFPLSSEDTEYYKNLYPQATHEFIPAFHPNNELAIQPGKGTYGLYHGNLSHPENREAVLYLLEEVFPYVDFPMIVAGKEPSKEIIEACGKMRDCKIIANPSFINMDELVQNAQIHMLPTFQQSGVKLKLINSLFAGRHVLVNNNMLHGTGLNDVCHIANSSEEFINKINELIHVPFSQKDIDNRREKLKAYNNSDNAGKLLEYFSKHQASASVGAE